MPTLTISGTISFPLGSEATPPERPFNAQLIYTQRSIQDIALASASGLSLMANIANAKACYVERITGDATFVINGSGSVDIAASGFWLYFNPAGGLTTLTTTFGSPASFRVYLFT
jgi:hypothetical protein